MVAPAVDDSHPVVCGMVTGIVLVREDESSGYRLGCLLLIQGLIDISQSCSHPETQGVGVFYPFVNVTVVNPVVCVPLCCGNVPVGSKGFNHAIEFGEHLRVDFLLRVVSHHGFFSLKHIGIWDGTVVVGEAVHDCHPEQIGKCHCYRVIRCVVQDSAVRSIKIGDDVLERRRTPLVIRIVCLPALCPFLVGGDISSVRTA